ncbi:MULTISPECIES: HlyD family secretion protein [unclassified Brevundimonas]|uniref:HlyD family secretion protein n=1 Tax=unclassified Brevundimonas TaxID=2622653 RepID=UPI003F908954
MAKTLERAHNLPRRTLVIALIVGGAVCALIAWGVISRQHRGPPVFTGYVVARNLYMAAPTAGTIVALSVERGHRVEAGAPLFRIDPTSLGARADQAAAQVNQSEASLAADAAALDKARADLAAAQVEFDRTVSDLNRYLAAEREKAGSVAAQQIDQARTAAVTAQRHRDAAATDVSAATARIAASRAQILGGRAGVVDARRQLSQLSPTAPVAARVEDVMYQVGEWVEANAPIVSLVPDGQVKVRFYVPEAMVNAYRPGAAVAVGCDGCPTGMTARVDYVANRPEYTPPIIYSLATRDKLVFLVEAVPSAPRSLTPGQPIDVRPASTPGREKR